MLPLLRNPVIPAKHHPPSLLRFVNLLLVIVSSSICILYLLFPPGTSLSSSFLSTFRQDAPLHPLLALSEVVFAVASNRKTWDNRKSYVQQWWRPREMRGCVFLDETDGFEDPDLQRLPPVCRSGDTSMFRYMNRGGLRSAIRVARVVVETVRLNYTGARWFVFGDDDTVFFPENVVKVLSKYDDGLWYYVGSSSEIYEQNRVFGFGMGFGGAGIAISAPLAKVMAKGFDKCIQRYSHLYGSDGRVHACLTELGVGLTREPSFHQFDIRGDPFGILAAHPSVPLASLHHIDHVDPLFPNTTRVTALRHLFTAANIDSQRLLQQTVCYARSASWTVSVSWGYAVQIFPSYVPLRQVLQVQETFRQWKKGNMLAKTYMFNTRGNHPDPCRRPAVFFMKNTTPHTGRIRSIYTKAYDDCTFEEAFSPRKLDEVRVFSHKLDLNIKQLKAPRRHCCDILDSSVRSIMKIAIRECRAEESGFVPQVWFYPDRIRSSNDPTV